MRLLRVIKVSFWAVIALASLNIAAKEAKPYQVSSPDGQIVVEVSDTNGKLKYSVSRQELPVIADSRLGLRFADQHGLDEDLRIVRASETSHDSSWEQPWGERRFVRDHHHQLHLDIERQNPKLKFSLVVRVFNDGVAFRYDVPAQQYINEVKIIDELSEFNMEKEATAWWIPGRQWNRYEYLYEQTSVEEMPMVHTPVTMRLRNGVHVSLHEAALVDYSGMSIEQHRPGNLKASLAPHADGTLVKTKTPFKTPWRTIQISADAVGLVNSDLILNLNEPSKLADVSWFKPGKYIGIWWQQHIRDRSWGNDGIHAATTEATIEMMDFAADHGFDGVLVEGWNTGWDGEWFNNGDVFSFTESYPDFDIEKVAEHGRKVGVRLIGHHETSGSVHNYESQLDDALDLYEANDVGIIKTGYVADGGDLKFVNEDGVVHYEWHGGQHSVDHHIRVLEKAADHKIAINSHEPVKDTGLRRTYPNWVSREGARGQEFNAWGIPPNGPNHISNLVYTRMLSGPMDYTAGAFDLRPNERPPISDKMPRNDPASRIEHTLAKELSLYVTVYSPIQMAMDLPENYLAKPKAFQFIKDVPADWEESIALSGEVGEFLVIARKDRNSDDWYLGAHTNEDAREVTADLSFLGKGRYEAQIYRDGKQADYDKNPYDMVIESKEVTAADQLEFVLGRSGGVAVRFMKLSD